MKGGIEDSSYRDDLDQPSHPDFRSTGMPKVPASSLAKMSIAVSSSTKAMRAVGFLALLRWQYPPSAPIRDCRGSDLHIFRWENPVQRLWPLLWLQ